MEKDIYDPSKPFNVHIRELIKSTQPQEGPIVVSQFGKRFKIDRDQSYWKDFSELTGSDTIGTKALLHWKMNTMEYGAQDAFAMVVDDLIEGGFVPVMLQNQLLIQKEDQKKIFSAIEGLVKLCQNNKWKYAEDKFNPIIITGGETAPINTIEGYEMGITATGYARKGEEILPNAQNGDVILGLASSGVHSNGLSFYRDELFTKRKMSLDTDLPWGITVGKELTRPTNVYLPAIKALIEGLTVQKGIVANKVIHGMVHITGGGLSKLKELSPKRNLDVEIRRGSSLKPQEIFKYAHDELKVSSQKMYERFNNGIGYVISVDPLVSKYALSILGKYFKADEIGSVKKGYGKVHVESGYDSSTVEYG